VPLAETGVLASWLLAGAGLALPGGPATVVPDCQSVTLDGDRLTGSAFVAWAGRSERVAVLVRRRSELIVASCRPDQLSITSARNLGGEPRDLVRFDLPLASTDHAAAGTGVDDRALLRRGAWTRVAMASGALEAISQMTIDYTHERQQFGRPVATFQAVQQHLVTATQCAVRATMAAQLATRSMMQRPDGIDIAAARVIVDDAIALGTRAAHQAHGAMGVTREYPLHQRTRRLWAWRHEYGSTSFWRRQLGRQVLDNGADDLFALITG
jgi:acyl-CoA dehydrogenase